MPITYRSSQSANIDLDILIKARSNFGHNVNSPDLHHFLQLSFCFKEMVPDYAMFSSRDQTSAVNDVYMILAGLCLRCLQKAKVEFAFVCTLHYK